MKDPVVRFTDLSAEYGDKRLFSDLNLHIQSGKRLAILGPSGCGKSTLLRIIAGIAVPGQRHSGNIVCNGNVSLLPQDSKDCVLPWKKTNRALEREMINLLGLSGLENKLPRHMSGGQLRRLALGSVISLKRDIVLLDEPLTGLDPDLRNRAIKAIISKLLKKSILVFVTHHKEEANELATDQLEFDKTLNTFKVI